MEYTSEEWSWIEAEWAFHCHGRTAFISPEDFRQAKVWADEGIPAEVVVAAMERFFERRVKRPRPRAFVAISHIKKDVTKAMSFRMALGRAGDAMAKEMPAWEAVKLPLKENPRAKVAFEAWMRLKSGAPSPESSGYLDHLDSERRAYKAFVEIAAESLGPRRAALEAELAKMLRSVDIPEGSAVWKRAWEHHFSKEVCAAWGLEGV
jgi:hypothetical protein